MNYTKHDWIAGLSIGFPIYYIVLIDNGFQNPTAMALLGAGVVYGSLHKIIQAFKFRFIPAAAIGACAGIAIMGVIWSHIEGRTEGYAIFGISAWVLLALGMWVGGFRKSMAKKEQVK